MTKKSDTGRTMFGLTKSEYLTILAAQGFRCAICQDPLRYELTDPRLPGPLDHDHLSGFIRGVLCSSCNHLLGCYEKWVLRHARRIDYYRANGAMTVAETLGRERPVKVVKRSRDREPDDA